MNISEILHRKILGVEAMYIYGAASIGIAIYAWHIHKQPAATADTTVAAPDGTDQAATSDATDFSAFGADSSGLAGTPTDTTATTVVTPVADTNEAWGARSIAYLITQGQESPGDIQLAITDYLAGRDLTYQQGALRDAAITKEGVPPEPLPGVGQTASKPAQRQFTSFPGTHTVTGPQDNTYGLLAQLYYGSTATVNIDLIRAANVSLGPSGGWPVGTKVIIPAYTTPIYFTATTGALTAAQIAAKNGISVAQLSVLNHGIVFPTTVGTKVRVH